MRTVTPQCLLETQQWCLTAEAVEGAGEGAYLHYPNQQVPEQTLQGALPSSLQLLCSVNIRMQNTTGQNDLDDKKHVNTLPSP